MALLTQGQGICVCHLNISSKSITKPLRLNLAPISTGRNNGFAITCFEAREFSQDRICSFFPSCTLRKTQSTWRWLESLHNSQSFEYFVTRPIVQAPCCHAFLLLLPQIFPQSFEEEKTLDRNSVCWEGRAVIPSGLRPVQRSATTTVYQQVVMAVGHRSQSSALQIFHNTDSPHCS